DRVGGRDHDVDGTVRVERGDAVSDDPLIDERANGIVQDDLAFVLAERLEHLPRRLIPGAATLEDLAELRELAAHERGDVLRPAGCDHEDHLIDLVALVECSESVLEDRLAGDLHHLLRDTQPEPCADAASQNHTYGAHTLDPYPWIEPPVLRTRPV